MASKQPTITMEVRNWRPKPGSPKLIEGLAYNDTRGMFEDREYVVIHPDCTREKWENHGTFYRVKVTDRFGIVYFRLDKHEEDKSD